jgi:hypothetical protein
VVRTRGLDHTITFLQTVHSQVCRRFYGSQCGPLYLPNYEFQKRWGKKTITTVGQAFSLLLREIPGVSAAAASALSEKYRTIANMDRSLSVLSTKEAQDEIAAVRKLGGTCQKIGNKLAVQIYQQMYEEY